MVVQKLAVPLQPVSLKNQKYGSKRVLWKIETIDVVQEIYSKAQAENSASKKRHLIYII